MAKETGSIKPVHAGGFYLENGLPDEYYAFTDGELSLTVERCGGINTLKVLDILEWKGKLYPDRSTETPPVFLRENNFCGKRPLYGPAVQFISESIQADGKRGRVLHHFPEKMELYPFGFLSESRRFGHRLGYDLCIDGRNVFFRFTNSYPDRAHLLISIDKAHIVSGRLKGCMKTQFHSVPYDLGGKTAYPETIPDTGHLNLKWDFVGYDSLAGGFVMDGRMRFAYGVKRITVLIRGNRPMKVRDTKTRYILVLPWFQNSAEDDIIVCLSVAGDRKAAMEQTESFISKGMSVILDKRKSVMEYAMHSPRIEIETIPPAGEYARTMPAFEKSMVLAETGKEACIRAATHKFGYFAGWDHIYPARAFTAMGDFELAEKLIRYLKDIPNAEAGYLQIIPTVEEFVGFSGRRDFLSEMYPDFRRYFMLMAKGVDVRTGFIRTKNGCGSDFPGELGIEGLVWTPCLNGWWYDVCRAMENLAILLNDTETAAVAREVAQRVFDNFLTTFFDEERGYLCYAVEVAGGRRVPVYQNVSTLGLDYPYGEYLLHKRMREISEYQAYALCHPNGRSSVSHDDNADEMWKNVIMFQHIGHEIKAARAGMLGDEAIRIISNFLRLFERCKVGVETYNITGAENDISQRANWQAFATAYGALIEGVIGIQWDLGGFGYAPCGMKDKMSLEGFRFRNTVWDIRVSGAGRYVGDFVVDGKPLAGTTRISTDLLQGNDCHKLQVVRSDNPFSRPTLLRASGASIIDLRSEEKRLSFDVTERVHTPVKIYCPSLPKVTLGGQAVDGEWDKHTGVLWCDIEVAPGKRVEVRI